MYTRIYDQKNHDTSMLTHLHTSISESDGKGRGPRGHHHVNQLAEPVGQAYEFVKQWLGGVVNRKGKPKKGEQS